MFKKKLQIIKSILLLGLFTSSLLIAISIPGAKPFHFTFEDSKKIGHKNALPFIVSKTHWIINGKKYLKSKSLNARKQGLKKNSNLDQTTTFQSILEKASADKNISTLYIPAGTYYFASKITLPSGLNIIGAGAGKTILERRDIKKYLVDVKKVDYKGAVIAGLTFSNPKRTIRMQRAKNIAFFHNEFKGWILRFEKSQNLIFEGNVFNENPSI